MTFIPFPSLMDWSNYAKKINVSKIFMRLKMLYLYYVYEDLNQIVKFTTPWSGQMLLLSWEIKKKLMYMKPSSKIVIYMTQKALGRGQNGWIVKMHKIFWISASVYRARLKILSILPLGDSQCLRQQLARLSRPVTSPGSKACRRHNKSWGWNYSANAGRIYICVCVCVCNDMIYR